MNNRAIDRIEVLLAKGTNVLFQEPENIFVNAPVAIHQIAFQNELNGVLLGIGFPKLMIRKLPIDNKTRSMILKTVKNIKTI